MHQIAAKLQPNEVVQIYGLRI